MALNPFSSRERQNFPAFSPVFSRAKTPAKTPSSSEKGFRWSIDMLARLKPADIDTDPTALGATNGHSPGDDELTQKDVDRFFSQKTILPSPWATSNSKAKKAVPKRVTFSPLPPATAYVNNESLVESQVRDSQSVDAGTQTTFTIPFDCDLEKLLGPALFYSDDRDANNSSLRRKLFGQPDREDTSGDSETDGMQTDWNHSPSLSRPLPASSPLQAQSSVTYSPFPVQPHHHHIPLSSPPLLFVHSPSSESEVCSHGDVNGCDTPHDRASSMVAPQSPENGLPDLSPISQQTTPFLATPIQLDLSPGSLTTAGTASPILSPIRAETNTQGSIPLTPMVMNARSRSESAGKTTSTPNHNAVLKRQLVTSPFSSPLLKQPCTQRSLTEEGEEEEGGSGSETDLPQSLCLEDLRSETYEFTDVTSTTCTSYFTNLGLHDNEEVQPCDDSDYLFFTPHPIHATAGGTAAISMQPPWQPPAHSTMMQQPPSRHDWGDRGGRGVVGQSILPSFICGDSGVAASSSYSGLTGHTNEFLGLAKSSSASGLNRDDSENSSKPVLTTTTSALSTRVMSTEPPLSPSGERFTLPQNLASVPKYHLVDLPTITENSKETRVQERETTTRGTLAEREDGRSCGAESLVAVAESSGGERSVAGEDILSALAPHEREDLEGDSGLVSSPDALSVPSRHLFSTSSAISKVTNYSPTSDNVTATLGSDRGVQDFVNPVRQNWTPPSRKLHAYQTTPTRLHPCHPLPPTHLHTPVEHNHRSPFGCANTASLESPAHLTLGSKFSVLPSRMKFSSSPLVRPPKGPGGLSSSPVPNFGVGKSVSCLKTPRRVGVGVRVGGSGRGGESGGYSNSSSEFAELVLKKKNALKSRLHFSSLNNSSGLNCLPALCSRSPLSELPFHNRTPSTSTPSPLPCHHGTPPPTHHPPHHLSHHTENHFPHPLLGFTEWPKR